MWPTPCAEGVCYDLAGNPDGTAVKLYAVEQEDCAATVIGQEFYKLVLRWGRGGATDC